MPEAHHTAQQVADLIGTFERSLDAAVAAGADILAKLPRAREELGINFLVGQRALDGMADALSATVLARRHAVAFHQRIDQVRELQALPEVKAAGDTTPKPPFERPSAIDSTVVSFRDAA